MVLSLLSSILAWIAKIKWSKEYTDAKEQVIKAKEAEIILLKEQIETYKDLTPMKIREYFISVKTQLEEHINLLQKKLEETNLILSEKEGKLQQLNSQSIQDSKAIAKYAEEKKELMLVIEEINKEALSLKDQLVDYDTNEKMADKLIDDYFAKKGRMSFLKGLLTPIKDLH